MPRNERCETCRYANIIWRKGEDYWTYKLGVRDQLCQRTGDHVECRRHAPVKAPHRNSYDGWPVVGSVNDWCGEYAQIEGQEA